MLDPKTDSYLASCCSRKKKERKEVLGHSSAHILQLNTLLIKDQQSIGEQDGSKDL